MKASLAMGRSLAAVRLLSVGLLCLLALYDAATARTGSWDFGYPRIEVSPAGQTGATSAQILASSAIDADEPSERASDRTAGTGGGVTGRLFVLRTSADCGSDGAARARPERPPRG